MKDKKKVVSVIRSYLEREKIDPVSSSLLIIGADIDDVEMAKVLGFTNITSSNIDGFGGHLALDAEHIDLPDDSFDVVFTHAVLHHCQSPHKAVLEAVRVCKNHFMFLEGNDSLLMYLAKTLRLHEPYEFPAVIAHSYESGGMRNSAVPNYIYRWSKKDLYKTVNTGFPERQIGINVYQFFDFYVNELDIDLRKTTRISKITSVIGTKNFINLLNMTQKIANTIPGIRHQGNHFFAGIAKGQLKPWIDVIDGRLGLKKTFNAS